jgi:endonuclease G, mitochondrial
LEENECGDEDIKQLTEKVLHPEQAFVRYALLSTSPSPEAQGILSASGVIWFDLDETRAIAGGESSSLAIPFAREEIGGVVTVLEQNAIYDYKRESAFVYFLLSGIGGILELAEDTPLILAIYCPHWVSEVNPQGEAGIVGFAEITGIRRSSYENAINAFEGIPTALAKEDLDFYRTFGENQVVAVLCEQVRLFSSPIPIPLSQEEADTDESEGLSEWNYLHRELVQHLASAVYLSETAAAFFRLLPEQTAEPAQDLGPDFDWSGPSEPGELQRFIRRSPLTFAMDFLHKAIENGKSVCLVEVPGTESCGSGVLVAPGLVLTCRHVLYPEETPRRHAPLDIRVSFQAGSPRDAIEVVAELAEIHPECDAVLLRLKGDDVLAGVALRPVSFSHVAPARDEDLSVLHHPHGGELQVTLSPGGVVGSFLGRRALQYVTATSPGSSGGPCFNSNWELVGIHRAQRSKGFWNYGEGVLVPTVLDRWIASIASASPAGVDVPSDT